METFTAVRHPHDLQYQLQRRAQIDELLKMSSAQLDRQLRYLAQQKPPRDDHQLVSKIMGEMYNAPYVPDAVKGILDSSSGTTGNVFIRQDLEPTLYALFVRSFPAFDRLPKGPANGLVHAATQMTAPDSGGSIGDSVITELGSVSFTNTSYNRATFPIAVFAKGRGVSFKETAAVAAGGAPYDPSKTEMANGMVALARDMQYYIMQGNATNSGGTGNNEGGPYNTNSFDGFRGVLGSYSSFSSNNAIQADISSLNYLESLQFVAGKGGNNGGNPSMAFMTINGKEALDTEQQTNVRYNNDLVEIIPGVRVNRVTWANGQLDLIPCPGNTFGTYNRTSDNALVEDTYVIDESTVTVRWLYNENFTVLELPPGYDNTLSSKWIIFGMYGLEQAAPLYNGKVRRLAS